MGTLGSSLPHFASPHTAPLWGPPDAVRPPLHPVLTGDSGGMLMAGTTSPSAVSSLPPTRAGDPGRGLGPDSHHLAGAVMRPRRGWGQGQLTCEAEIRETSCRPVRSEDETLAGAPLCSLMLTFLSLSTREIALGEVLPGRQGGGSGWGRGRGRRSGGRCLLSRRNNGAMCRCRSASRGFLFCNSLLVGCWEKQ